jgi:hypothetical protein
MNDMDSDRGSRAPLTTTQVWLRLLTAMVALGAGVVAAVVVIDQLRTALAG